MKSYWKKEIHRKLAFIMALVLIWCTVYYEKPMVAEADQGMTISGGDSASDGDVSGGNSKVEDSGFAFENYNQDAYTVMYSEGGTVTNIAGGGNGTGTISYSSSDENVATVDGNGLVSVLKAGVTRITAIRQEDANYLSISTWYDLTVSFGTQNELTFEGEEPGEVLFGNGYYQREAIGGSGDGEVEYSIVQSNPDGAATVNSTTGKVDFIKPGKVTVKAEKAGGSKWDSISATYELTIIGEQEVSFEGTKQPGTNLQLADNSDIYYGQSLEIIATGKGKNGTPDESVGGTVTYTVVSGGDAVAISDPARGVVTFQDQKTGSFVVKANIEPDDGAYCNSAEGTFTVNVKYLPTPSTAYTLSGKQNNGWYTGEVRINAPDGYKISYSNSLTENTWEDYVILSNEENGIVSGKLIYLKSVSDTAENGGITEGIIVEDIKRDYTKPTELTITYAQENKTTDIILGALTFGIYKGNVEVTISAKDDESGLSHFVYSYAVADGADSINQGMSETYIDLQEGQTSYTFTIPAQFRGKVAFKAVNNVGKESFLEDAKYVVVDNITPNCQVDYSGNFVTAIDAVGTLTSVSDGNARLIYDSVITAKIKITESNFDLNKNEININVYKDGIEIGQGEGYVFAEADWTYDNINKLYERSILLGKDSNNNLMDGDYDIHIEYMDAANNQMVTYQSAKYCVATQAPTITVTYDNNEVTNNAYYNRTRMATVTVNGRNVLKQDITVSVTAVDKNGSVPFDLNSKMSEWRVVETIAGCPSKWQATIAYDIDATYSFTATCRNILGREGSVSDTFMIDSTAPDKSKFTIEYSVPLLEKVLSGITFKYYQPSVSVTISAEDDASGVGSLTWQYIREEGSSAVNADIVSTTFTESQLQYNADGTVATASFTLSAEEAKQYRGKINVIAVDRAGNSSDNHVEDKTVIVVDDIAPTRTVEYSPAKQVVKKDTLVTVDEQILRNENSNLILYYDAPMTLSLHVNEANFYAEDVVVMVNDKRYTNINWSQNGDVWTGVIGLSASGDYVVAMSYKDRSNNEMISYISEQITIDTTNPVMSVSYSGGMKEIYDGRAYSDSPVTVTVSVTEHNFRAVDMDASVSAYDVSSSSVTAADLASHLKNPSNWSTNGDTHTAAYTFASDANYNVSVNYRDLAGRHADGSQSVEFTVDQASPENLKISYSQSFFETVLQTITFGYYNAPVIVTLSADDATSGVNKFEYSYLNAEGVSKVNAEQSGIVVDESHITYSNGRRTATAVIQIPASELRENNQFNGTINFLVYDRVGRSNSYQDNKRIVVDSRAPITTVEYSVPVRTEDKVSYYAGIIDATVRVNEANFDREGVIITVSRDGKTAEPIKVDWRDENVDEHVGFFQLTEDGDYVVQVDYADYAGNQMQTYKSNQLTIDTAYPKITLEGLKDHSANKDAQIGFVLIVEDTNLDTKSIKPVVMAEIVDEDGGFVKKDITDVGEVKVEQAGSKYVYTITNLEEDGVYSVTCSATDMATNATDSIFVDESGADSEKLIFSVNRKGSAYNLVAGDTVLGQYVQACEDIVIRELNATKLSDLKVTLYKNDKTIILEEGKDYHLDIAGGNGEWYSYIYTINKDNFLDDGVYRIALYSKDEAGNVAENTLDVKDLELSFAVDKTMPNLIVTNLESGVTYPTENHKVVIQALDNLKLSSVVVNLDGKEYKSWSAEEIAEIEKQNGEYVIAIPGTTTQSHTMEILLSDAANNVYTQTITGFYVTTNKWVQFYNNRLLFFGTIAAGVVAVGGTVTVTAMVARRKKKRKK